MNKLSIVLSAGISVISAGVLFAGISAQFDLQARSAMLLSPAALESGQAAEQILPSKAEVEPAEPQKLSGKAVLGVFMPRPEFPPLPGRCQVVFYDENFRPAANRPSAVRVALALRNVRDGSMQNYALTGDSTAKAQITEGRDGQTLVKYEDTFGIGKYGKTVMEMKLGRDSKITYLKVIDYKVTPVGSSVVEELESYECKNEIKAKI